MLDVLNIYLADIAKGKARPEEIKQRVLTLADFWQPFTLADVNGQRCRDYVAWRVGQPWKSSRPGTDRDFRAESKPKVNSMGFIFTTKDMK